jgi:hypothetical protein
MRRPARLPLYPTTAAGRRVSFHKSGVRCRSTLNTIQHFISTTNEVKLAAARAVLNTAGQAFRDATDKLVVCQGPTRPWRKLY